MLSAEELSALEEVLQQSDDLVVGGGSDSEGEDVDAHALSAILSEGAPLAAGSANLCGGDDDNNDDDDDAPANPIGAHRGETPLSESRRAHDHASEYGLGESARASSAGWVGGESELRVLRADKGTRHTGGRVGGFLQVDELDWMREALKRGGGGACSFDASHSLLVVGQSSGAVLIADRETREVVQTLAPPRLNPAGLGGGGAAVCVKLCPLGRYVVAAYWNGGGEGGNGGGSCEVRVFDWRRNSLVKSVQNRHLAPVSKLEFIGSTRFLSADTQGLVLLITLSHMLMMTVVNVDVVLAVADGLGEIFALGILHRAHHKADGCSREGGDVDGSKLDKKKDKDEASSLDCLLAIGTRDLVFVAAIWPTTRILFKLPCPSSQPQEGRVRGPSVAWRPAPDKSEGACERRGGVLRATLVVGWASAVKFISLEFCDGGAGTRLWSSPVSSRAPTPSPAAHRPQGGAGADGAAAGGGKSSHSLSPGAGGAQGQARPRLRRAGVPDSICKLSSSHEKEP